MLTPDLVLKAYRAGAFPMADPRTGIICWHSPDPRAVLPLESFRVSRSLRRSRKRFAVTFDRDFEGVMDGCADRPNSWISSPLRDAYVDLFRLGRAHSVESWAGAVLAGGVYGVHVGGAFMAESMFHRRTDAGKAALWALVERLKERGFALCDIQMVTPATAPFGPVEVSRSEYLRRLRAAVDRPVTWGTDPPCVPPGRG